MSIIAKPVYAHENWILGGVYAKELLDEDAVKFILEAFGPVVDTAGTVLIAHNDELYDNNSQILSENPPQVFAKKHNLMTLPYSQDFVIALDVRPRRYNQLIFQLSHEVGHVIMECRPTESRFKWISEVLCGFITFELSRDFLKYKNLNRMYNESQTIKLDAYYQNVINEIQDNDRALNLHSLYNKYSNELKIDPYGNTTNPKKARYRNNAFARQLLLQENQFSWESFIYSIKNIPEGDDTIDIHDFFKIWKKKTSNFDFVTFFQDSVLHD